MFHITQLVNGLTVLEVMKCNCVDSNCSEKKGRLRSGDLVEVRKKYFEERSLYSLFRNVNLETFFNYPQGIGTLYKEQIF